MSRTGARIIAMNFGVKKIARWCCPPSMRAITSQLHARMESQSEEIANLKEEIEGYESELENATTRDEKLTWAGLIKSRSDNLTELEKRKNARQQREAAAPPGNSIL